MSAFALGVRAAQERRPVWWVVNHTRDLPAATRREVRKGYVSYRRIAHVHR